MFDKTNSWVRGLVTASCVVVVVAFSAPPALAAGSGTPQWRLADAAGTTCFNLVVADALTGPQVSATRQTLQEAVGERDAVYVEGFGGRSAGERWQIVRDAGPMHHPATGTRVGNVLEILGVAEVVTSNAETSILRIVGACREVEIGDYLRQPPVEAPRERWPELPVFDADFLVTAEDADAFVVLGALESVASQTEMGVRESVTSYEMYATRDLLVIDQGLGDAWQMADMAMIYRDRLYGVSRSDIESFTRPVGRGVVVYTDASSAILQITDSVEEIQIGDRARKAGSALDYVNNPPSITCRVEQNRVRNGESVRLTATVADPDGDATSVSWEATSGTLSAETGTATTWTADAVGEGAVTIRATVEDGRDLFADCDLALTVAAAPAAAAGVGGDPEPEILDFMCPEFPSGSTVVDNRCKAVLDDVALRLRQNPLGTAEIVGHADTTGDDEGNQTASRERAENARDYLVETHGIDPATVRTSGAGSSNPIADNTTEEGQLRNRRVEIRVTLPGGAPEGSLPAAGPSGG